MNLKKQIYKTKQNKKKIHGPTTDGHGPTYLVHAGVPAARDGAALAVEEGQLHAVLARQARQPLLWVFCKLNGGCCDGV